MTHSVLAAEEVAAFDSDEEFDMGDPLIPVNRPSSVNRVTSEEIREEDRYAALLAMGFTSEDLDRFEAALVEERRIVAVGRGLGTVFGLSFVLAPFFMTHPTAWDFISDISVGYVFRFMVKDHFVEWCHDAQALWQKMKQLDLAQLFDQSARDIQSALCHVGAVLVREGFCGMGGFVLGMAQSLFLVKVFMLLGAAIAGACVGSGHGAAVLLSATILAYGVSALLAFGRYVMIRHYVKAAEAWLIGAWETGHVTLLAFSAYLFAWEEGDSLGIRTRKTLYAVCALSAAILSALYMQIPAVLAGVQSLPIVMQAAFTQAGLVMLFVATVAARTVQFVRDCAKTFADFPKFLYAVKVGLTERRLSASMEAALTWQEQALLASVPSAVWQKAGLAHLTQVQQLAFARANWCQLGMGVRAFYHMKAALSTAAAILTITGCDFGIAMVTLATQAPPAQGPLLTSRLQVVATCYYYLADMVGTWGFFASQAARHHTHGRKNTTPRRLSDSRDSEKMPLLSPSSTRSSNQAMSRGWSVGGFWDYRNRTPAKKTDSVRWSFSAENRESDVDMRKSCAF